MQINGVLQKFYYRDYKTGYSRFSVLSSKETGGTELIFCSGKIPNIPKRVPVIMEGEYTTNKQRRFFVLSNITENFNQTDAFIKFLSSGIFEDVGPASAKKIISILDGNIYNIYEEKYLDKLKEKYDEDFVEYLSNTIFSMKDKIDVFNYIVKFSGTFKDATKISDAFGGNGLAELKKNPYRIGIKLGLSFSICDCIAKDCNFDYLDDSRLDMIGIKASNQISLNGDTYIDIDTFIIYFRKIERKGYFSTEVPVYYIFSSLLSNKFISLKEKNGKTFVYNKYILKIENGIVDELRRLKMSSTNLSYKKEEIDGFDKEQNDAVDFLQSTGVKIVTGGPGTGKTTIIKKIVEKFRNEYPDESFALCAPTGRAAARITESTGIPASTIHRLLEFKPFGSGGEMTCGFDAENRFSHKLFIIDEMSMVDIEIFLKFIRAVENNSLVLLFGDVNQLKSVGPGNLLDDLIKSDIFDVVRLVTVHRQKAGNTIIANSQKINSSDINLEVNDDFQIFQFNNYADIRNKVLELFEQYNVKDNPYAMQIMSPVRRDVNLGTYAINNMVTDTLTEPSYYVYGNQKFRLNDKVILIKNNYDPENTYMNGDIGNISGFTQNSIYVSSCDNNITIDNEHMEELELAYAVTIHKCQGSECDTAVIIVPDAPSIMLTKRLLYTAVTRAKNKVIILSLNNGLYQCIMNENEVERKTGLCTLLKEKLA